ncbi:glycosyltransferase family 4 protein [Exiguobacterium sp. ZWU0009]|uniref:glycosyltransferase family 4 protein n=1 Tax=Exiguobacterium sp. ZWU0009 TaxID=1224749 RepID=UPI000648EE0B|nr:glycosyltransferase family 4 protein [Exiguobacterium sp. ZWU0009]
MKKIVFVINYFHPDYASTGQLMTELCLHIKDDFEITVIAAQPGYSEDTYLGKPNKKIETEYWNGIKVIRVQVDQVNKRSKLSRIRYISRYFLLANIALLKEKNVDLIYTISQPPILGGLIGTIGKFLKRSKHLYNIQDFNPEQAAAVNYTGGTVHKIAKQIDKLNCSYSDHIILVGNDMKETLSNRFGNKHYLSHSVINNWTDENEIIPLSKNELHVSEFLKEHNLEEKFIIMYSGNLGLFYDLENLIKISSALQSIPDIHFLYVGEGASKKDMQDYVSKEGLKNVTFLPYQPKEFIKYSLNVADVHLVVNQKGIKGVSVPSKIYGVMAAGKPILGVLEQGSEAEFLISTSNSGLVSEPQDYRKFAENIKSIYELTQEERHAMGMRGRQYLDQHLRKELSLNKYKETLTTIINN